MAIMKTKLVTLAAVAVASGAFAQGQVSFSNMISGTPTPFVYLSLPGGLTKVPASTGTNFQAYAVDLYYWPYSTQDPSLLRPMGLTTYFSTNPSQAGLFSAGTSVTVPYSWGLATLQIRAWETKGGLYTSYAAARDSWGGAFIGEGNLVQVTLGFPPMPPPNMVGIGPMVMRDRIPEPTAAAIAGLGLTAMLIFRRKVPGAGGGKNCAEGGFRHDAESQSPEACASHNSRLRLASTSAFGMKKALATLAAVAVATGAFAQGQVIFKNMISGTPTPFVYLPGGVTKVPASTGANFQAYAADLYYGPAGIWNPNLLTPMGLTIYFSKNPSQAGLFSAPTAVSIPGMAGGSVATLQIRVWETKGGLYTSWAAAWWARASRVGEGNLVQVTLGTPPMPPPNMVGIQPILMFGAIPEPTAAAIAGLGLAAMLILRRKVPGAGDGKN
jgi:hypothetical protein